MTDRPDTLPLTALCHKALVDAIRAARNKHGLALDAEIAEELPAAFLRYGLSLDAARLSPPSPPSPPSPLDDATLDRCIEAVLPDLTVAEIVAAGAPSKARIARVRAALASPAPLPAPEPSALRALDDLLWWAEYVADRDENKHSKDLADTDEEAERRWLLLNTLNDLDARVAWLRSWLPSEAAASSGSRSTSASVPSGSLSPGSEGSADPAPSALREAASWALQLIEALEFEDDDPPTEQIDRLRAALASDPLPAPRLDQEDAK